VIISPNNPIASGLTTFIGRTPFLVVDKCLTSSHHSVNGNGCVNVLLFW
jgi:hypothetical protein